VSVLAQSSASGRQDESGTRSSRSNRGIVKLAIFGVVLVGGIVVKVLKRS
jgi:hypothetical protein